MKTNVKVDVDELKQKSEGFINEFKSFVMRGNVMDMAVGVIIECNYSFYLLFSLSKSLISSKSKTSSLFFTCTSFASFF